MKKLLSALTALCMCASMTTGLLPASALNALNPDDAAILSYEDTVHNQGHEYAIADVTFDPATEDYVMVPVTVWNDPGVYGLSFEFTIDGKTPDDPDFPFVSDGVENGGGYKQTLNFVGNQKALSVIWSCKNEETDDVAADGSTFVELYFAPKDGVEYVPGTVYNVEFSASTVGNQAGTVLNPVLTNGSITIAGAEPTTTEPPTDPTPTETDPVPTETDPTPTETDPVPTETTPVEQQEKNVNTEWVISHETVKPGENVSLTVSVN